MTTHARIPQLLVLTLLLVFAGPALAADAPSPEAPTAPPVAESADTPETAPADTTTELATEPALGSALEQSHQQQFGDCALFCDGQQVRYSFVTREECCSGTLTCPDGSTSAGYAFYPYQGFAEFCSV